MLQLNRRQALIGLHIGAITFGLAGIFGKLALAGPVLIVFGRALIALLCLLPLVRRPWPAQWQELRVPLLGGVLLGLHWLSFFQAVKVAGVGLATLGFASFPAFTLVLESLLFREQIRRSEWLVLLLVSSGLVLVTPTFSLQADSTVGLLWGVFSGLTFALLSLANRQTPASLSPMQAAWWQNLFIVLMLAGWAVPELPSVTALDWLWLAALGLLCTAYPHTVLVASVRVLKARDAALIFALEPVYALLFAWWLFSETPSLSMLGGAGLILLAIALSSRPSAKH
ncbi:EamA domain-containing membrane protein RarD [Atopomonas hussainii]|uniref:EamA domain-containing membrane protein RarD n=1 Tax=Atopomonas hussainii TaxID=1429083 RepID=A0A1H7RQD9_9GAMM|nr:EamA domain-containing membrane protein RarD [Atopomonas hussainii]